MKKYFLFLSLVVSLFLFSFLPCKSQKVSLKTVKIHYIRLPLEPLDKDIKTCHATVIVPQRRDDPAYQNQHIPVEGLKYVQKTEEADLRIELDFLEFVMDNPKLISGEVYRINTGKNEKGYYYLVGFNFPGTLQVTTRDGKTLLKRTITPDSSARFKKYGMWTFSENELANNFSGEGEKISEQAFRSCYQSVKKQSTDLVNSYFGHTPVTYKLKIVTAKGKKTPYAGRLRKAEQYVEQAFETDAYRPGEGNDEWLDKAVAIWQEILAEYTPGRKSPVSYNLKMLLLYNSATVSRWMNRFDEARKEAGEAIAMINKETPEKYKKLILPLPEEIRIREERAKNNNL